MKAPKVIYFDVNETLLDMSSVKSVIAARLGGDKSLVPIWFSTLLHHSLVDCASGQFHSFSDIGAAALVMVAKNNGVDVSLDDAKTDISQAMTSAPTHADVCEALELLSCTNIRLVALSNSSCKGLEEQLTNAGIIDYFDRVLSVETVRTYKPYPAVYHWALNQMGISAIDGMMVAAHGWDVTGAKAVGMQTTFVEREGQCTYPLGLPVDNTVPNLNVLASQLMAN